MFIRIGVMLTGMSGTCWKIQWPDTWHGAHTCRLPHLMEMGYSSKNMDNLTITKWANSGMTKPGLPP